MKGRKTRLITQEVPKRPGWRDYFQMITTFLMVALGAYILWQAIFVRWVLPSLIFGGALLLFGLFRIRMIWFYFSQRGKRYGT
jgi:NhaP-type Na+/H+ or K+/H+ antiporter